MQLKYLSCLKVKVYSPALPELLRLSKSLNSLAPWQIQHALEGPQSYPKKQELSLTWSDQEEAGKVNLFGKVVLTTRFRAKASNLRYN